MRRYVTAACLYFGVVGVVAGLLYSGLPSLVAMIVGALCLGFFSSSVDRS